jgi:hypothetical protein
LFIMPVKSSREEEEEGYAAKVFDDALGEAEGFGASFLPPSRWGGGAGAGAGADIVRNVGPCSCCACVWCVGGKESRETRNLKAGMSVRGDGMSRKHDMFVFLHCRWVGRGSASSRGRVYVSA